MERNCVFCSGSHLRVESSSESGGRRDTGASLDSVGASSGSLSPLEPPSPLFQLDGGGEGSLTSEVFLNVLKLNQNRKRQETRYGTHPLVQIQSLGPRQLSSHQNVTMHPTQRVLLAAEPRVCLLLILNKTGKGKSLRSPSYIMLVTGTD